MRGVSRTLVSLFAALLLDRQWRLAIAAHGAVVATASVLLAVAICGYAARGYSVRPGIGDAA